MVEGDGWTVAALLLAAGAVALAGVQLAERRMQRKVEVDVRPLAYVGRCAALERGRYLFASRGCVDCHGADGAGRTFVDDAGSLHIKGSNITTGPASVVADYRPEDWVRAIRHGVAPGGRPLMIMPSEDYNRFTDADLAALVADVPLAAAGRAAPAVVRLPLPARVLYGFGAIDDAAAKIDHACRRAAGGRGHQRRARRLRRQHVPGLPRSAPGRRPHPRRAAGLAGGVQAHARRRLGAGPLRRSPIADPRCSARGQRADGPRCR